MTDLSRAGGFEESAQRVEEVLEVVRAELGQTTEDTDWAGLARHLASGAADTRELAVQLAGSQGGAENNALVHLFLLRQLEISLTFISKLSGQISLLQGRLEDLEGRQDDPAAGDTA